MVKDWCGLGVIPISRLVLCANKLESTEMIFPVVITSWLLM